MNKTQENQAIINDYAKSSLRDVADQDYIAARMSCRAHLREPFLWSSLQAFEKYLKAILLYNGKSAKGLGHKLNKALQRVEAITDICFSIPDDVRLFIDYLDSFGENRYLEHSAHLRVNALLDLDRSVWHVRKYCFYMRGEIEYENGKKVSLLPRRVEKVTDKYYDKHPFEYKLFNGYLENIIKKDEEPAKQLIRHNFYYGRRKKNIIKSYKQHLSSVEPDITSNPEIFDVLSELVDFSSKTKRYFKERGYK